MRCAILCGLMVAGSGPAKQICRARKSLESALLQCAAARQRVSIISQVAVNIWDVAEAPKPFVARSCAAGAVFRARRPAAHDGTRQKTRARTCSSATQKWRPALRNTPTTACWLPLQLKSGLQHHTRKEAAGCGGCVPVCLAGGAAHKVQHSARAVVVTWLAAAAKQQRRLKSSVGACEGTHIQANSNLTSTSLQLSTRLNRSGFLRRERRTTSEL